MMRLFNFPFLDVRFVSLGLLIRVKVPIGLSLSILIFYYRLLIM